MSRFDFSNVDFQEQGSQILELLGTAFERIKASQLVVNEVAEYTRLYGQVELIKYNSDDEPEDVTTAENISAPDVRLQYLKLRLSEEYVWWSSFTAGLKAIFDMNKDDGIKENSAAIVNYLVGGELRAIVSAAEGLGVNEDWLLNISSLKLRED